MELAELKTLWQTYDDKLQKSLQLNLKVVEQLGIQKVTSSFGAVIRFKIIAVVLGILWNILLGSLIFTFPGEPVLVISLAAIMLVNTIVIAGYIYQLVIIQQINFQEPVIETQRKLAVLQASFIRITRIAFLQAPFYATFFISKHLLQNGGISFWIIETLVLALLVLITIWLYRNISFKNINRPLVKMVIENEGGKAIAKATAFMREIEAYKNS